MSDLDSNSIKELFDSIIGILNARKNLSNKGNTAKHLDDLNTGYQSPIKGDWKNSGAFSPNTATDARHPNGHQGIDIRAPGGTEVYPIANGVVTNAGTDPKGGNVVNVMHDNNVKTYYAHLSSVKVKKGDKVTKDTAIGTIGDSGNAKGTAPHCHFQVWQNGQLTDPAKFFSVPAYTKMDKTELAWLPGAQEKYNRKIV